MNDTLILDLVQKALQEARDFERLKKENNTLNGFVRFTNKEVAQMPNKDKKYFTIEGRLVRCRERTDKNCKSIELNYRRDGYNVWASGTTIEEAKAKFIERLQIINAGGEKTSRTPTNFKEFTLYYFNVFRKRKVKEMTVEKDLNRIKNHLFPSFGSLPISEITYTMIQDILDRLTEQGKGKTVDELHSLLNLIFKSALAHGIIKRNPMELVVHNTHDREHGTALTKAEEKKLLDYFAGTKYQILFAVALYTGLRPNEYATARIDGEFIVANNSKRKNGKTEAKKIPIIPMLKPYITDGAVLEFPSLHTMYIYFHRVFGKTKKLYDLRTTFYTRCQEYGVAVPARDEFVGHSSTALSNAYTDLSDEFLISEGQKLSYSYDFPTNIPTNTEKARIE